jgi:2-polyprenyl-3-methyl-5-hydroxy-6-metoxy-1,4-benzoquinol methylase/spore maturation protein CgeB
MAGEDRISEAYRGEIFNPRSRQRARDRIDWLVAQARGEVLDVGCSQGIASILCARRGLRVLGVDLDPEQIAYARADAEHKPPEVRERLEFRVAEVSALELPDDSFDTVLFGEVLEHLEDPSPALSELSRVCRQDGIIVLTTPFGLHPHQDHTDAFFLASLVDVLAEQITVDSIDIVDGYFRVVARPGPMSPEARAQLIVDAQPLLEDRFLAIHRELYVVKERRKRLAEHAWGQWRKLRRRTWLKRRAEWQLRAVQATRLWRLRMALIRLAHHPGRILLLPRDVARAMRKRPLPPPPSRPRPKEPHVRSPQSTKHAELASGKDLPLEVEIPRVAVPSGPVARPELTVATILDRFTATALRYEWHQLQFGPDDWREVLERDRPDMLFVESAWRGNDDRWRDLLVGHNPDRESPLNDLVAWCREHGIPTVFWNKEDPPNFARFIDAARLFDHVFTVDGDCIMRYAEVLGREDVGVLQFGAQPRIHNPISVDGGRRYDVVFAGTYFPRKHPGRRVQMETILAPAREFGLHIFSRIIQGEDARYDWPAAYRPHVVGSIPYERMLAAYKAYKVFLNVNSVTESPTMCARRVFELSACSTPVLSGYSRAIGEVFGDLVPVSHTPDETRAKLADLLDDAEGRERRAHEAMREVFSSHTYGHRVEEVLRVAGLADAAGPPAVSVLMPVPGSQGVDDALAQVARQAWRPLQLVIADQASELDPGAVEDRARALGLEDVVVVTADPSLSPAGCLNLALDSATGDLIAVLDPDSDYEQDFLGDLAQAFSYTDARVVGKRAHYADDGTGETQLRHAAEEHSYTDDLEPGTLLLDGALLRRLRFDPSSADPEADLLRRASSEGARLYGADRFSFVSRRRERDRARV